MSFDYWKLDKPPMPLRDEPMRPSEPRGHWNDNLGIPYPTGLIMPKGWWGGECIIFGVGDEPVIHVTVKPDDATPPQSTDEKYPAT